MYFPISLLIDKEVSSVVPTPVIELINVNILEKEHGCVPVATKCEQEYQIPVFVQLHEMQMEA